MNEKILKIVAEKEELFVPLIFTEKQFSVLKKYSNRLRLSNAEKKSLYTSVKKKMEALDSLSREQKDREYWVSGSSEIIPARLAEAKKLIDGYSKKHDKVFIAGSFLFSKEFNDIDVFIIAKKGYKEKWDENKHVIFLSEKRLTNPVFQSASLISASNFMIPNNAKKKKPSLSRLMGTYHEAVIEHMRKEKKPESVRRLVFDYNLFCRNRLLNGRELKEISSKIKLEHLDMLMKELCKNIFSETYLYVEVHTYIKTLEESIKNIKPNSHLVRFKNAYEEMIYGRQKSKAEIA
ncbi:MAG: hypothetical protein Q7J54_05035 [Candidatus Woesearchaeota archaeon]|nr:hypothetical protein [Candidatus Woesearchaeota archaeon]